MQTTLSRQELNIRVMYTGLHDLEFTTGHYSHKVIVFTSPCAIATGLSGLSEHYQQNCQG